jgi:hypothetical protein
VPLATIKSLPKPCILVKVIGVTGLYSLNQ